MRLAAGLCPDPLGGYSAPPDSLAVIRGEREGLGIGRGRREVRERIGMEGGRERGQEKERDGSIWIFIQGPRVTLLVWRKRTVARLLNAHRHIRKRATLNAGYRGGT